MKSTIEEKVQAYIENAIERGGYETAQMASTIVYMIEQDAREKETDWNAQAKQDGEYLAGDIEKEIAEAVRTYRDSKEGDKSDDEAEYDETDVQSIFDDLYQEEDTMHRAWEYADGHFIYNSTDALAEAMQCIDRLDEYASGDSGLWEGKTEYWDIINIQAADAYRGAVHHYAEEAIKAAISGSLGIE